MNGICSYLFRTRSVLVRFSSPIIFSNLVKKQVKTLPSVFITSYNFGTSKHNESQASRTLLLTKIEVDLQFIKKKKMTDPTRYHVKSAILRYKIGDERFQFSFMLNSGKVFNFDRLVSETLESFETRIKANMLKKFKAAEINAKLALPSQFQPTDALEPFLQHLANNSGLITFQINDSVADVNVNPPEIFAVKFHEKPLAEFPFHPIKVEGSESLNLDHSTFLWEYTKDRELSKAVLGKKKGSVAKPKTENWVSCGDKMIIYPDRELDGAFLRLTCTPSDGQRFGSAFITEVTEPVRSLPVPKLLCEERLERLQPISADPNTLRIVSYNILADTYATPEWFINSPPESLDLSYRLPILEKEIESYNGDIICLQEVEDKVFEGGLQPFLLKVKNLQGIFSSKTGNTKEGVATFYNPQKLKLLEHETVELAEMLKSQPFWESVKSCENVVARIQERNTVLQLVVMENKNDDGSIILLGVTHLYFHPNADHIRLLQTMTCIRSIESKLLELQQVYKNRVIRVFFAGDFNCTPPFSSFRLLTTGKVEANDDDWICHEPERLIPGIQFQHNLRLQNSNTNEELTNITLCFEGCIDYILYQPSSAQLIKSYPPPDKATIASLVDCKDFQVSLPNWHCASDHLPLIADFKLI